MFDVGISIYSPYVKTFSPVDFNCKLFRNILISKVSKKEIFSNCTQVDFNKCRDIVKRLTRFYIVFKGKYFIKE